MTYDVDYFIRKFSNSREDKWCTGMYFDNYGRACALGWCGLGSNDQDKNLDEALALQNLFHPISVSAINDGDVDEYPQISPKRRILSALYDVKKKLQQPHYKDITSEIANLPIQQEVSDKPNKVLV